MTTMDSNLELFARTLARAFGELPLSERLLAVVEKAEQKVISRVFAIVEKAEQKSHPGHSLTEDETEDEKAGYSAEFPSDYGRKR